MGNGRVVMLVDNGVRGDSRVQKVARSAASAAAIDELAPDLIHAHDTRMLGVGARAKERNPAIRLVWDAHEFLPGARPRRDNARWLPAHRAYEREYAPAADAVVTVSDTLAEMLQPEYQLPR